MREKRYICGICGKEHIGLDAYLECVAKCGEKLKKEREAEKEKKHAEEVNAALNGVKQAKIYYEQKMKEFKEKYPEEYKLNFGETHTCKVDGSTISTDSYSTKPNTTTVAHNSNKDKLESVEFLYEKDGKDEPKISAKVNGKEVAEKDILSKLEADPDTKFIAQLLGLM